MYMAGLHALSQSLAKYLGQYCVLVTAVAPGFVESALPQALEIVVPA